MAKPIQDLPMGFGMALLQNEDAALRFYALPQSQQEDIISKTRNIASKSEMRAYVARIADELQSTGQAGKGGFV